MANNYTMFSFEIPLTAAELPWVKETLGKPPRELWPEGYEAEDEPEVEFDWCIEDQDTPTPCLFIYSEEGGNPDAAETFCKLFLANAPTDLKMIGFEMAYTCSKPRPGEFGGAACLVYVAPNGDIESKWNSTCSWLDEEMGKVKKSPDDEFEIFCKFCGKSVPVEEARRHEGDFVGECCWDERLRSTE